ncbi:MAG: ATP-binding protein [Deltaproteobacteria bacterium]|nr:ATP-binding protein [Deltaproteobacteria bacterium]
MDSANQRMMWQNLAASLHADKTMLLVSGPRQCGKTTLAKAIGTGYANCDGVNWDIAAQRSRVLGNPNFFTTMRRRDRSTPLVLLDEIHKYRDWKNYLKGLADEHGAAYRFLVTGSGRLDLCQPGGDSLAGRYLSFQLWPFTLAELAGRRRDFAQWAADPLAVELGDLPSLRQIWASLLRFSGFPEPLMAARDTFYRRWSLAYRKTLVGEDIRDAAAIRRVAEVETLFALLPERVGSPLSLPALSTALRVAYTSVQAWLDLYERFYLTVTVPAWAGDLARAVVKERKAYLMDFGTVTSAPARLENAVAVELARAASAWTAWGHGEFSLHFVRTKDGAEVDFLLARDRKPFLLVEVKTGDESPSGPMLAIQRKLRVPAVQLVDGMDRFAVFQNDFGGVVVAPACAWLALLPG